MFNINKPKFRKGFGILEVLVSAVIIITILMALVFIGQTALANSVYTQQRAQATFLAQEGIETVRQIRDTNWIDGLNTTQWDSLMWSSGAKAKITPGDYKFDSSRSLISGTDESITINTTTYKRTVNVALVGNLLPKDATNWATTAATDVNSANNALKIKVTVSFDNITGNKTISASEVITNWRPNY